MEGRRGTTDSGRRCPVTLGRGFEGRSAEGGSGRGVPGGRSTEGGSVREVR